VNAHLKPSLWAVVAVARGLPTFLTLLVLLGAEPLFAHLHWEKTEILLTPKSTAVSATAEFIFTNRGVADVFIDDIHPDCNCVTTPLNKTRYAPGESGRLVATFAVGHQTGEVTVPIQVRSREGMSGVANSAVLLLRVKIAEVVSFSPRFLYWKKGDPREPKTVDVSILHGEPITLREVHVENPAFRAKLMPTDDQERFILRVEPPPEGGRALCPLTVISESRESPAQKNEHTMIARIL